MVAPIMVQIGRQIAIQIAKDGAEWVVKAAFRQGVKIALSEVELPEVLYHEGWIYVLQPNGTYKTQGGDRQS